MSIRAIPCICLLALGGCDRATPDAVEARPEPASKAADAPAPTPQAEPDAALTKAGLEQVVRERDLDGLAPYLPEAGAVFGDMASRDAALAYLKTHPETFAILAHALAQDDLPRDETTGQLGRVRVDWTALPMEVRAEGVRARVLALPPADGLPAAMLGSAPIANVVKVDGCDEGECTTTTKMDAAALGAWLAAFEEIPGWDVAALSACKDDCCTFENLARAATKEGGMVPHELLELRAVCFEDDGTLRRIKWVHY